MNRSIFLLAKVFALTTGALIAGCAGMTVTKVTDKDVSTKGLRYYLPKPYLLAAPEADGTVSIEVIFLPDKSRSYAIDTSSYLSTYTFQASRDEKGLLTALEFKANTTAIGQQLASSAGSYATQAYNIKAAGAVATQTQVNTAQTSLDTARATLAAAEAVLASDQTNGAKSETVTADFAAVASAKAKAQIAEQALQRAQTTNQIVSNAVANSAPITTAAPSMGTALTQSTWATPTTLNLSNKYGPVLYALNDDGNTVKLTAVQATLQDATVAASGEVQTGVLPNAQPTFKTTAASLGPPSLFPTDQTQTVSLKLATFIFDRPVNSLNSLGSSVVTDTTPPVPMASAAPKLSADLKTLTIDTSNLKSGHYIVTIAYSYQVDSAGTKMSATKQVKLSLTP